MILLLAGVYLGIGLLTLAFVIYAEVDRRRFLISRDRWPEADPETLGLRLATYLACLLAWPLYWLLFMGFNP